MLLIEIFNKNWIKGVERFLIASEIDNSTNEAYLDSNSR